MNERTMRFLILVLFLGQNLVFSQAKGFKKYTQKIAGTNLNIQMVPIPAGKFTMGSQADSGHADADERPAHEVKIDAFYMSEVEMTWEIYMLFINRTVDNVTDEVKTGKITKEVDAVSGRRFLMLI